MSADTEEAREARERAEAKLKRAEEAARDRKSARADYEAQARATRENTARLKALRLEKQAAEAKAVAGKTRGGRRKVPPS